MALSTRYMIDGISSIWATPYKKSYPQLLYRMQAVLDFFNERRYQMTIEQAVHGGLSLKEKMWIILRLLLGADRFEKWRYRLTGGKPPAPEVHERDSVD